MTTTSGLRAAMDSDLPSIVDLFRSSSDFPLQGVAYPRWDSASEVASELEAYGARLSDAVYLLPDGDGVTGLLGDPSEDDAYVIGPLLRTPGDDVQYAEILAQVELLARERNLKRLKTSVPSDAEIRLRALALRGYERKSTAVEMVRWRGSRPSREAEGDQESLRLETLTRASPARWLARMAELLREELNWSDERPVDRLRSYVEPPYRARLAFCRKGGDAEDPCGVLITWSDAASSFARIEYLAVAKPNRRRGAGERLMIDALANLGDVDVYLQVDEWRAPAIRLYERLAFKKNQVSIAFEKPLRASSS